MAKDNKKYEVIFTHPTMVNNPLMVKVKPDQIVWSYQLNTKNYPTYGGEVVQILSMAVGDMTIQGTVGTYAEMEHIYSWFIGYMQNATQGRSKAVNYDTRPVIMEYPHRQWKFSIYPTKLPGFRYGKDVVAPTWQLQAAVSEYDDNFKDAMLNDLQFAGEAKAGGFEPFGTATAGIGFEENNPWSSMTPEQEDAKETEEQVDKIVDYFSKLIPAYLEDDFSSLQPDYSKPSSGDKKKGGKQKKPAKPKGQQ